MTALTLTPRPTVGASVLIAVTGAPAGALAITRTDDNGSGTVRLQAGQVPIAGSLTVADFEAALTGTIGYQVRDAAGVYTSATTTLAGLAPYGPHLVVPVNPQLRLDLAVVLDNPHVEDANTSFHDVIGRPDAIPTVTGPLNLRHGSMTVRCADYPTSRQLRSLAAAGATLMFRQPDHPGMDMYFAVASLATAKADRTAAGWYFDVDLSYRETADPVAPLTGTLGWNWGTVRDNGTWADLRAQLPTWNDVLVGPPPFSGP